MAGVGTIGGTRFWTSGSLHRLAQAARLSVSIRTAPYLSLVAMASPAIAVLSLAGCGGTDDKLPPDTRITPPQDLFFTSADERIASGGQPIKSGEIAVQAPNVQSGVRISFVLNPDALTTYFVGQGVKAEELDKDGLAVLAAALKSDPGLLDLSQVEPRNDGTTLNVGPFHVPHPGTTRPLPVYVLAYAVDDLLAKKTGVETVVCDPAGISLDQCGSRLSPVDGAKPISFELPKDLSVSGEEDVRFAVNFRIAFDASGIIPGHRWVGLGQLIVATE